MEFFLNWVAEHWVLSLAFALIGACVVGTVATATVRIAALFALGSAEQRKRFARHEPGSWNAVAEPPADVFHELALSAFDLLDALDQYGPTYVERMPGQVRTAIGELRKAADAADAAMPDLSAAERGREEGA